MTSAPWIDQIGRQHCRAVAAELGLEVQKPRGASGGSFECPACGAKRRHPTRKDPRLAVGVRPAGDGWRCYQCDVSGDQLHLVALKLEGRRWNELADDAKGRVREWVTSWLRLGGAEAPATAAALAHDGDPLVAGEDAPPEYPAPDEVARFWDAGRSILVDGRVCSWIADARGLPVKAVARADLMRALRYGQPCPKWAVKVLRADEPDEERVPWSKTAYRAIFPLYDASGALRSVLARFVGTPKFENVPKSRAPIGFQRRGLVLADKAGRELLAGEPSALPRRVVIAEGEMDMIAFSVRAPAQRPATEATRRELVCVLGIVSGSWTAELAARIPDGSTVLIATHDDGGGEKYAAAITKTLLERMKAGAIRAERWKAS